ncbi:MAG: hypothetical protein A2077_07450 [Nitrospirae bacterium GWC2_46_6]|nr:MAG: hypothetical protein A2077_07450 [Nitrospirae bacterium GWC2_46_6]OGW21990.1 MAG: hypothetical protein A2Z82_05180 [Nitrospirae bacterium GWA2_46_11]OGW22967.1 MAG: hypothetical protein A2X55_12805 [Nitrospirae bacterium GWB2_47_37]HAK89950.1 hypothetical protein [Nitrospiraceae bacterium]HCL81255.1 hypothetical protein [Nitrospiraceae bacterium]
MYKGIYVAMSGAVLRSQELDNVANNLANAATAGYKKTGFSSRFYPMLEGISKAQDSVYPDARAMTHWGEYSIDTSNGNIKTTGNPLDVAVQGDGFFAVENKGKTYYTRNGSFSRNKEGFLTTMIGQKVLDTANKPIRLNGGVGVSIAADGNIYVDGNAAAKLKVAKIDNVQHVGESLFSGDEAGESKGEVIQGGIEMSNVNPVRELVGIITALRQFDAAQKVIKHFDDLSQRAVSEIAKV